MAALYLAANPGSNPSQIASALNNAVTPNILLGVRGDVFPGGNNRLLFAGFPSDVQVTGSANNGSPPVGSQVTFTFLVKNAGPTGTLDPVVFTSTLPAALSLASITTSVGSCTGSQTVTCSVGNLVNGAQATIKIVANVTAAGTLVVGGSAPITDQTDAAPANNTASVTVTAR